MLDTILVLVMSILMLAVFYEVYCYMTFNEPMLRYGITFGSFSIEGIDFEAINRIKPKSFMKGSIIEDRKEVCFRRKYYSQTAILLNYWYSPYMAIMRYNSESRRFDVQLKLARAAAYMTIIILTMCAVGVFALKTRVSGVLVLYFIIGCVYWFLHYLSFRNIKDEVITLLEAQAQKGT